MNRTQGRRRTNDDSIQRYSTLEPGDYWPDSANVAFHGICPNGFHCNLSAHCVVEHDDGTITVSPSILTKDGQGNEWHGYLKAGVWEEC